MSIVLKSSNGDKFKVRRAVALQIQPIRHYLEDLRLDDANPTFPLALESKILAKVIKYSKRHVVVTDDNLDAFDAEFVRVKNATLLKLVKAASYLQMESLFNLTCQAMADRMNVMSLEEIRRTFDVENFTPQEVEKIRKETPWAFE